MTPSPSPHSALSGASPAVADYLSQLSIAGEQIVRLASDGEWTADIPTCSPWTLDSLVRHVGTAHRWAADVVGNARTGRHREMFGLLMQFAPAAREIPADALTQWFADGLATVQTTIADAPADLDCWSFLPGTHGALFWSRRQAHETAMHAIDAQLAKVSARDVAPVEPWFAADGVDELLTGFVARAGAALRFDQPRTLAVTATGLNGDRPATPSTWLVTIGPDAISTVPSPSAQDLAGAEASLTGTPHDLYCALWNRPTIGEVTVGGDAELVEAWHRDVRIV